MIKATLGNSIVEILNWVFIEQAVISSKQREGQLVAVHRNVLIYKRSLGDKTEKQNGSHEKQVTYWDMLTHWRL